MNSYGILKIGKIAKERYGGRKWIKDVLLNYVRLWKHSKRMLFL